jgi:hypothetical protein
MSRAISLSPLRSCPVLPTYPTSAGRTVAPCLAISPDIIDHYNEEEKPSPASRADRLSSCYYWLKRLRGIGGDGFITKPQPRAPAPARMFVLIFIYFSIIHLRIEPCINVDSMLYSISILFNCHRRRDFDHTSQNFLYLLVMVRSILFSYVRV